MQSIANKLREINFDKSAPWTFERIEKFEIDHYKMKNDYADMRENLKQVKYELDQIKKDDKFQLTEISKKLSKTSKNSGQDEMMKDLALMRAKIMDHFMLAYLADTGLKPNEVKIVQGFNDEGYVEIYFEKSIRVQCSISLTLLHSFKQGKHTQTIKVNFANGAPMFQLLQPIGTSVCLQSALHSDQ